MCALSDFHLSLNSKFLTTKKGQVFHDYYLILRRKQSIKTRLDLLIIAYLKCSQTCQTWHVKKKEAVNISALGFVTNKKQIIFVDIVISSPIGKLIF